jgi:imidazolonepropionase-like amidohydrolase
MPSVRAIALTRRQLLATSTLLAAGVLACAKKTGSPTEATLALRDARLFAARDATTGDGMTIAMDGARIVAVGRDADVKLARGARVIDCAGAFVMPGLIDTHTHVTITLVRKEPLFGQWLRAGLTTVRDTGTVKQGPAVIRNIARELAPVPRIVSAGPIMTVPGGYPTTRPDIGEAVSFTVSGPAEATAGVNKILDDGADFIKIAVENGLPSGHLLEDAHAPTLNLVEIRAIVAAAHARGKRVSAHVSNVSEMQAALAGGVDAMAHTPLDLPIPKDTMRTMLDRGVPLTATLNIWGGGKFLKQAQDNIAAYHAAGGVVTFGTDYPYQTFEGLPIDELRLMQEAGLSAADILLAATRDAAALCGLGDVGTVAVGKIADVIIVQGDPSRDVTDLAHVTKVIQGGKEVV